MRLATSTGPASNAISFVFGMEVTWELTQKQMKLDQVCARVCVRVCVYVRLCVCVHAGACVCVCVCICCALARSVHVFLVHGARVRKRARASALLCDACKTSPVVFEAFGVASGRSAEAP